MADNKISIGGQALIEGIMMKGPDKYSVAVRKPDGTIETKIYDVKPPKFKKIPLIRGIFNLIDSIATGYKMLEYSAGVSIGDLSQSEDKFDIWCREHFGEKAEEIITLIAGVLGVFLSLALFMVLPTFITGIINAVIPLGRFKAAVEGIIKIGIFLCYLILVSKISDIKRVFMYHGAEHKTIACFESGEALTVENVKKHTRFHPRCGTSFMFIVLVVSIVIFSFVPWKSTLIRAGLKLLFLPLVIGVSYEVLKLSAKYDNTLTRLLVKPGLFMQNFTTYEPDDSMIEIAIASVNAILPQTIVEKVNDNG